MGEVNATNRLPFINNARPWDEAVYISVWTNTHMEGVVLFYIIYFLWGDGILTIMVFNSVILE